MTTMVEKSNKVDHKGSLEHKHRICPCISGNWCIEVWLC